MKKLYLLFCIIISTFSINAQLVVSETSIDMGDLYLESERFTDIAIKNNGEKHEFILRVVKPEAVKYIFTLKKIDVDSTSILRLFVDPTEKGKFNHEVQLFLSDRYEAITISLTGINKEVPRQNTASLQGCPDFNSNPIQSDFTDFDLRIKVIDEATGEPIKKAEVFAYNNGQPFLNKFTSREGVINEDGAVGYYFFDAKHPEYIPAEHDQYINFRRNFVLIKMRKNPEPVVDTTDVIVLNVEEPDEEIEDEIVIVEPDLDTIVIEETIVFEEPTIPEVERSFEDAIEDYSINDFKPSNIVFVIDVSSSMKDKGRLELLKIALHQLKEMLRPQDKVCIVTYSTTAKIFLESTTGDDKDNIGKIINKLYAGGFTAGGDGILLGYNQAKVNYIEGGNNQVIIVTDGAFNRGETAYKKKIASEKEKRNINISVVGIKDTPQSEASMREVADLGKGDYIELDRVRDAETNIKINILKNSYRHK